MEIFKTPREETFVNTPTVTCDGGVDTGHPRVYLDVAKEGKVMCPYCSQTFVLKNLPR